jgi:hypothetical protein
VCDPADSSRGVQASEPGGGSGLHVRREGYLGALSSSRTPNPILWLEYGHHDHFSAYKVFIKLITLQPLMVHTPATKRLTQLIPLSLLRKWCPFPVLRGNAYTMSRQNEQTLSSRAVG